MGVLSVPAFLLDEHVRADTAQRVLTAYDVIQLAPGTDDLEILDRTESDGRIVVTADVWFLRELVRLPVTSPRAYRRAGVVQVPGEWEPAQRRLARFLPLIETMHHLAHAHPLDHRVGVNLSRAEIRLFAPWD